MGMTSDQGPSDAFRPGAPRPEPRSGGGLSAEDLITLNEEIAGMARAGLPLDQGLAVLAREMGSGKLQAVTDQLAADLRDGKSLAEALERQGRRVPPFYAGLVAAGVRSGRISEVLATLTLYTRTLADLRSAIINALIYPAVVILLAIILFGFLGQFLVPQFERIFQDFRMRLPVATEFSLALGRHSLLVFVTPPLTLVVLLFGVRFLLRQTERGRLIWARWLYALPIFGTLLRSARLSAFTELLGILVDYDVPLPEAFRLAGEASSDPLLAAASVRVQEDLSHGQSLAEALHKQHVIPEVVTWMAGLGAQRNTLGQTMHRVGEMYRRQAEMRVALLRSVLPPVLVIISAGLVIGLFVISLFLPLITLLGGLSGGNFLR
jgi:type II secretory pathway component PulF